jgi:hypothetical protein
MRNLTRVAVISLVAIGLIATVAPARAKDPQSKTEQKQDVGSDEQSTRAIRQKVREGTLDGMELVVFDVKKDEKGNEKLIANLDPSRNFQKGDEIKVQFWSSFDGYVYFVNVEPSGNRTIIYPVAGGEEQSNIVHARKLYLLPRATTFEFDAEKGTEVIQVIMSRQPIPFFDVAIKNSDGALGKTAASAAAELVSLASKKKAGIDTETIAKVLPETDAYLLTRKVRLAPPKDKDDKGTLIAIPDGLKNGGIGVFEIRLKHM